jgi:hypothetical protein
LDLKTAQSEIASNWIEAYQKYVGESPPAPIDRETKTAPANSTANEVWVNTRSGKYSKSSIKIKTAGAAAISPGSKVKSVHEAKADFRVEFEDGSSATLCLANPGSAVAVRDKNNAVEYLG